MGDGPRATLRSVARAYGDPEPARPLQRLPQHAHDFDVVQLPNWRSYNEADLSDKPQELRAQPNIADPGGLGHGELRDCSTHEALLEAM